MRRAGPPSVLFANPGADLFGSDRMLLEAVRGFRAAGHTVIVTLPEAGPLVEELEGVGAEVVLQATPVLRKGYMSLSGVATLAVQTLLALPGTVRTLRRIRPTVLVVNTITIPLWLLAGRLIPRVRVACHVHEAERALPSALRWGLYLPLFFAHRVIANSEYTLRVLTDTVPRLARRAVVVHNAVAGPVEVPAPRPELVDDVRLLYLGRISERKGVLVAIRALELLCRQGVAARLRLVGSVFAGNESFLSQAQAEVARRGLDAVVEFAGFKPVVWPELVDSDIVVMPSILDESFGNVAVEAALAARPAAVSDIEGLREATSHSGSVVLVSPGDPAALACAVRQLVDDWPQQVAKAVAAAPVVASRYSADRFTNGLLLAVGLPLRGH